MKPSRCIITWKGKRKKEKGKTRLSWAHINVSPSLNNHTEHLHGTNPCARHKMPQHFQTRSKRQTSRWGFTWARFEEFRCPNVSIIYLLWSQADSSFSTQGWIRPRHRAMASITGLSGSINHWITGACGVCSSSLLLRPYQPHRGGFCLAAVPVKPAALIQPRRGMEMPRGSEGPGHAEKPL